MMQEASGMDCLIALENDLKASGSGEYDGEGSWRILAINLGRQALHLTKQYESTICDSEDWRSAHLSSSDDTIVSAVSFAESHKVKELEEEQERLNNSLFSLSTHFAQVQFRLKQIGDAKGEDKEKLLKDLQDFAFQGCADMSELKRLRSSSSSDAEVMAQQKEKQNKLIKQLRDQLEELEHFAYESGEGGVPSKVIIQRQKAVLDKLKEKIELNVQVDEMDLTDLQKQVDEALQQLINPFKAKEQLVEQLQTQIVDLERFVTFLQAENEDNAVAAPAAGDVVKSMGANASRATPKKGLFGFPPFSANSHFQKNQLKQTPKGRHYGDERAHLQLAIDAVDQVLSKYTLFAVEPTERPEVDVHDPIDDEVFERSEEEVVSAVRKQLCHALLLLLQHGMQPMAAAPPPSSSAIGCFAGGNTRPRKSARQLTHIWDVVLFFYDSKGMGDASDAPVRRLSQSFRLDSVAGKSITSKQILLSTIESIIQSHARLKRSPDAQWKAFVSAALNQKKLPAWMRIIFRSRQVVESCFYSWSYVSRTGCEELYALLEGLQKYNVHLPVDLALRPFEQIKEAF